MSFSKNPTTTAGDLIYCDQTVTGAPGRLARLIPNSTATQFILAQTSSAPSWVNPNTVLFASGNVVGGTGASFPASNRVGETVSSINIVGVTLTSDTLQNLTFITLPSDGVWTIGCTVQVSRGAATYTTTVFDTMFAQASASTTNTVEGLTLLYSAAWAAVGFFQCVTIIPDVPCVLVGSTLTLPNGSTMTLTNSRVYLNYKTGVFTGGPSTALYSIVATRIS